MPPSFDLWTLIYFLTMVAIGATLMWLLLKTFLVLSALVGMYLLYRSWARRSKAKLSPQCLDFVIIQQSQSGSTGTKLVERAVIK